ncbi:PREDICTED: myb-related transcription factor, partner of profilin-like [Lepidothrix coronata]|uniref:Myb-related transcription factor, partner of profilin-like n=1 Tax=Lepidothrix coronata TaxID=321398 RepID=A0A6J0H010_9PASS|nr:PREDICTED: myb-related transcription factor, partner of profilin-like [Lepidothrix coronata]
MMDPPPPSPPPPSAPPPDRPRPARSWSRGRAHPLGGRACAGRGRCGRARGGRAVRAGGVPEVSVAIPLSLPPPPLPAAVEAPRRPIAHTGRLPPVLPIPWLALRPGRELRPGLSIIVTRGDGMELTPRPSSVCGDPTTGRTGDPQQALLRGLGALAEGEGLDGGAGGPSRWGVTPVGSPLCCSATALYII